MPNSMLNDKQKQIIDMAKARAAKIIKESKVAAEIEKAKNTLKSCEDVTIGSLDFEQFEKRISKGGGGGGLGG